MIKEYIYEETYPTEIMLLLTRRDLMDIHREDNFNENIFTSGVILRFCPNRINYLTFFIQEKYVYAAFYYHSKLQWVVSFLISDFPYWEDINEVVIFSDDIFYQLLNGFVEI